MIYLRFLVGFPHRDQARPPFIAQVDSASGHLHETVGTNLLAANQGHDEAVRERPQFFGKVQGKRGPGAPKLDNKTVCNQY